MCVLQSLTWLLVPYLARCCHFLPQWGFQGRLRKHVERSDVSGGGVGVEQSLHLDVFATPRGAACWLGMVLECRNVPGRMREIRSV